MRIIKTLICLLTFMALGTITAISVQVTPDDDAISLEMESLAWGTNGYLLEPVILSEALFILNTIHDADKLKDLTDLESVDYSEYFVMALFLGQQPSLNYSITIEEITREEDQLLIRSAFTAPTTEIVDTAISSPYHIVKVRRGDHEWDQDINMGVLFNGTQWLTETHYLSAPSQMVTLEKISADSGWESSELHFEVITHWRDIANVENWISASAVAALQELDYAQQYAVVVFQGSKPSTGYSITIKEITRKGDTVTLQCDRTLVERDNIIGAGFTSPYHLVQLDRVYERGREINFILEVDNQQILTQTRVISGLMSSTLHGTFYPSEDRTGYEIVLENQGTQAAEGIVLSTYTEYDGVAFDNTNWSCEEADREQICQRAVEDLQPGQMITTTFVFDALDLPFARGPQSCFIRVKFEEPLITASATGMAVHRLTGTGESVFDYVAPGVPCPDEAIYLPLIIR